MRTKLFHTVVVVGAAFVSSLGPAACSGDAEDDSEVENGAARQNDTGDAGPDAALPDAGADADAGWHPTK